MAVAAPVRDRVGARACSDQSPPKTVGGRLIGVVVMLVGIGFLSVLTATIASHFVKTERPDDQILERLERIEAELRLLRTGEQVPQ